MRQPLLPTPTAPRPQMTISPKRKRGPSDPAVPLPFAPRLDTSAFPGPAGPVDLTPDSDPRPAALLAPGSESPRSRIANQFEGLQIKGGALPAINFGSGDACPTSAAATKKAKYASDEKPAPAHLDASNSLPQRPHSPPPHQLLEVAETPQSSFSIGAPLSARPSSPPPPSSSPSVKLFLSTRRPDPKLHRRSPSPSDRSFSSSSPVASSSSFAGSADTTMNPFSPELTSLTWQDDEITGHLVDADRDDDGYGINGVGFRPTHAVAQQRAIKRRQQVLEWRAREAREARQKRSERRRGAAVGPAAGKIGEDQKRVVRFA